VRRLFPDYRAAEEAYLAKTGFFPIMHLIVVRRELAERHRWLAGSLYQAFDQVRRAGIARLWDTGSLAAAVPWLYAELERTAKLFGSGRGGDGFWPYGVQANSPAIEYMAEQSFRQGLSPRRVAVDELFAPIE
jgi:4,5-dihydroxyphthalate decarboxylase